MADVGWGADAPARALAVPALARPRSSVAVWRGRTLALAGVLTALRLAFVSTTGLSHTEAYYASWARFPSWSYYDHPPLLAWLLWLTTRASCSPLAVRSVGVACAALTAILLHRLSERLFGPRAAFLAVAVASALPACFVSSVVASPEAPLAPLWVLALLLLDDLRERDEPWRPLALGAAIGAAFLAKYTGLLLVGVSLLFVATSPRTRRWLRRPSLYVGGLVALLVSSPVIAWNALHGWPSVELHLAERVGDASPSALASRAAATAIGQWIAFHPLAMPALLASLATSVARSPRDPHHRLIACASGPVLAFFLVMMARVRDAEPHWTIVGWLPLAIACGAAIDGAIRRGARAVLACSAGCAAFSVVVAAALVAHVASGRLAGLLPRTWYDGERDPVGELAGWDEVAREIETETARLGPRAVVASAQNVLCGRILVAIADRPTVYCPSRRRTEYDFVGRREPPTGAPVLFVDSARHPAKAGIALPGRECRLVRVLEVRRSGSRLARYRLTACSPAAGVAHE